jgi:hypothetical protein
MKEREEDRQKQCDRDRETTYVMGEKERNTNRERKKGS